jgi:hypothetical protein
MAYPKHGRSTGLKYFQGLGNGAKNFLKKLGGKFVEIL